MPSSAHLLTFALACVVLVLIPGPSVLFVVGRALASGRAEAVLSVVGNSLGLLTQGLLIVAGIGPLVAASVAGFAVLKLAGAAYLVWLGIQTVRHREDAATALSGDLPPARPARHAVWTGFTVGVTNPKALVFTAALLPQFVDPVGHGPVWSQMVVLVVILTTIGMLSDLTMALAAGAARDWFASSPQRLERLGGVGGVMMVGLGVALAFTGRPGTTT